MLTEKRSNRWNGKTVHQAPVPLERNVERLDNIDASITRSHCRSTGTMFGGTTTSRKSFRSSTIPLGIGRNDMCWISTDPDRLAEKMGEQHPSMSPLRAHAR
jgi:hypothetical protein